MTMLPLSQNIIDTLNEKFAIKSIATQENFNENPKLAIMNVLNVKLFWLEDNSYYLFDPDNKICCLVDIDDPTDIDIHRYSNTPKRVEKFLKDKDLFETYEFRAKAGYGIMCDGETISAEQICSYFKSLVM